MIDSVFSSNVFRFGAAACVVAIGLSWSLPADAQMFQDVAPHRIDFSADVKLPNCNVPDEFYAVLASWVPVHAVDQTAPRTLVIRIKRLRDGGKDVETMVTDENGKELAKEQKKYSPPTECFKVLFWTAYDAARLMRETSPKELPDDKDEPAPAETCPKLAPIVEEPAKLDESKAPAGAKGYQVSFGPGISVGFGRQWLPGMRLTGARTFDPWMIEFDVRLFPPLLSVDFGNDIVGRPNTFLAGISGCRRVALFFGCAIVSGGIIAVSVPGREFTDDTGSGVITVGVRSGLDVPLTTHWSIKTDVEVSLMSRINDNNMGQLLLGEPRLYTATLFTSVGYRF